MIKLVVLLLCAVSVYATEEDTPEFEKAKIVREVKLNGDYLIDFGTVSEEYNLGGPSIAKMGFTNVVVEDDEVIGWHENCSESIITDQRIISDLAELRQSLSNKDPTTLGPDDKWLSVMYSLETIELLSSDYRNVDFETKFDGARQIDESKDLGFTSYPQPVYSPTDRTIYNSYEGGEPILAVVNADREFDTIFGNCLLKDLYDEKFTDVYPDETSLEVDT